MNIGEASEITRIPAKTIRYYESIGLVVADRQTNGYRHYDPKHIHQLRLVGRARSLGFTVGDCRSLLSLYDGKHHTSDDVRSIVEARLREIEGKIAELQSLEALLSQLIGTCGGAGRPDDALFDHLVRPNDAGITDEMTYVRRRAG